MVKKVLSFCSLEQGEKVHQILRQDGYSVLWVIDTEEALAFLRTGEFDMIIIERHLHTEAFAAIEELARDRGVPIVFFGAKSSHTRGGNTVSGKVEDEVQRLLIRLKGSPNSF
jgi:PleD family two-component response regulator